MTQNTQNTTDNGSSGTGYLVPVECAVAYGQAGLSVLAASGEGKRPLARGWKNNMTHRNTEQQTRAEWKRYQPDALCIVCGAISGNLEVIDFDNGGELFRKWAVPLPQELYDRLLVEQSQSGGFHVAYRCKEQVDRGHKLATRKLDGRTTTLIETRGEGNVILCAPSSGYILKRGDWCIIPLVSAQERQTLLSAAEALDEKDSEAEEMVSATDMMACQNSLSSSAGTNLWTIPPIDDFKQQGDIHPYLEKAGWVLLRTDGKGEEYWRRPEQPVKDRHGATLNNGVFHIFSSNAAPFEIDKNYDKFDVYALLEHNGDKTAAVSALVKAGYGRRAECTVDMSSMTCKGKAMITKAMAENVGDVGVSAVGDDDGNVGNGVGDVGVSVVGDGKSETDWPPIVLAPEPPPPPPFPIEAMPDVLGEMARAISATCKVPVAIPASALLAAAGLAIGRNVFFRVKKDLTGRANLFMLVFAARGERKSTVFGPVMEGFRPWIGKQMQEYNAEMSDLGIIEARRNNIRQRLAKPLQRNEAETNELRSELAKVEAQLASKPANPNIFCNDLTDEALKQRLALCGGTAGIFSDDSRGMLKQIMGVRYSKDGDAHDDTLLDAFDGTKDLNYERAQRSIIPVKRPCVGLLLMAQNDMLPRLYGNGELMSSGFNSRCLFCFPESWVGEVDEHGNLLRDYDETVIDPMLETRYANLIFGLMEAAYNRKEVVFVELTPDAKAFWIERFREIERESGRNGIYREVIDTAIRYPTQGLRLSLICALVNGHSSIDGKDTRDGFRLLSYYIACIERIHALFSECLLPMDSRRVLLHFQRHSDRKFYTLRDIYRDMNMKAEDAEKAVITLAKRNYCRMDKNNHIEVNPQVFTLPD